MVRSGIDLNKPVSFFNASFRFFDKEEFHITRHSKTDVLLLVFDGILRFSEDGASHEVKPGEYYIQRAGGYQSADTESDAPKYLYVHFLGEWTEEENALKERGVFDISKLFPIMRELDRVSHRDGTYTERAALFLTVLSMLYSSSKQESLADKIAKHISDNMLTLTSLDEICREFCYSKNHIINVFKSEYGMTPIEYLGHVRIKQAMYQAEVTSKPLGAIAEEVGFNNYSHFYRLFVRKVGMSPEKWRENVRKEIT